MHCEPFPVVLNTFANSDGFSKICPYFRNLERFYFTLRYKEFQEVPADANPACLIAYLWSHSMLIARDAISRDPNIVPVKFEEIVARPKETLRQLFYSIGIEDIHVDNAVTSMERDSQKESVMGRDRLASNKYISTSDRIRVDAIFSKFDLPSLENNFRI